MNHVTHPLSSSDISIFSELKKFKAVKDGGAHSEKKKNTSQTAVGNVWEKMKADFLAADELE